MKQNQRIEQNPNKTTDRDQIQFLLTPEFLSASVLKSCHKINSLQLSDLAIELHQQAKAVHADDLSRAEEMLITQAHTLDGLFATLAIKAMNATGMDTMERYLRLALKSQNQARATLQTLAELKTPKQIAFVKQANIGHQVQVNNEGKAASESKTTRTRKKPKTPNELLEEQDGQWLDTRAAGSAGSNDPEMEAVGAEHRTNYRRR